MQQVHRRGRGEYKIERVESITLKKNGNSSWVHMRIMRSQGTTETSEGTGGCHEGKGMISGNEGVGEVKAQRRVVTER